MYTNLNFSWTDSESIFGNSFLYKMENNLQVDKDITWLGSTGTTSLHNYRTVIATIRHIKMQVHLTKHWIQWSSLECGTEIYIGMWGWNGVWANSRYISVLDQKGVLELRATGQIAIKAMYYTGYWALEILLWELLCLRTVTSYHYLGAQILQIGEQEKKICAGDN